MKRSAHADDAVAPGPLGGVEALVGEAGERGEVAPILDRGDADTRRDGQPGSERVPALVPDALSDAGAAGGGRVRLGGRHQDEELLAAAADRHVGPAQDVAEQRGDADEDAVADVMAEAVVDRLEAVEIDDGETQRAAFALGREMLEPPREVAAVVETRQPVALGLLAELLLQCFELPGPALELVVRVG